MIRVKINQPNASEMFLKALKENKVIAYPTDTIYGVGTAVTNDKGIDKINEMKKRQQPMSIALANFDIIKNTIIADEHKLLKIQEILKDGSTCIANYKPGSFNNKITQDGKIGFRIPNHHFLKSVLNKANEKKLIFRFGIELEFCLFSDVDLAPIFSDHMVLQQKSEVPIWGKASPGEMITLNSSWKSNLKVKTRGEHYKMK